MATLNKIILLFLGLFSPFAPLAWGKEDVNIAAAYSAELSDGWARYMLWQQPSNGKIVAKRNERGKKIVEIATGITPKKESPLAALYTESAKHKGDNVGILSPISFPYDVLLSS